MSTSEQEKLSPELAGALARVPFRDARAAAVNLARLGKHLSPGLAAMLPTLLEESPDPDGALNLLERLAEAAGSEVLRQFERQSFLLHYALVVFGASPWLGETLIQNPDLFHALGREKNLERTHSREEFRESLARFRSRSFETDAALLLARFKRREYIRILLRDLLGIATLAETTSEISALADVLVEEALREADTVLRNRYGAPQHTDAHGRLVETPFAVLSLGKLGGNELNYSSDVDLLYIYGDGERPGTAAVSNREYFIRLAQQVTEVLSRPTREGSVFRIDLRLRPQGREGEPAVALAHALRYYAETAHDWEMQALIKARHSAGELGLAREFLRGVQPYVYKAQLNFAAIETALDAREKIGSRRRLLAARAGAAALDVKLDRGGIRDVEFLVQCLQRVYGGAEPWLRSGGTLFSLQKLHDKGHLSGKDFHELNSGYELLRKVEHRLQVRRGQQTHRLPEPEAELRALARSVASEAPGSARAEDLPGILRQRMAGLAEIYHHIIHSEQQVGEAAEGEFRLRAAAVESGREPSYTDILGRLATDAPALYELASRRELGTHTRRNLHRFLSAAFTSSERYAAVARAPEAVERALRLFGVSDFLTDVLIRHPEEIATVAEMQGGQADAGELFAGEAQAEPAHDPVFEFLAAAPGSYGEKLALLRQHYRRRVFAAGARDVMAPRPVYESLAEMTAAADDAIRAAWGLAEAEDFSILALGRLGSEEFDIASDADLLFVREERADAAQAARAAERVVEALAAYTKEGILFAVDPRLRPRGGEGELVVTPTSLEQYFAEAAQPWEALTYTKLRRIAGPEELAQRAIARVDRHLTRFAADPAFAAAVREMRAKVEKAESEPNFKTVAGGFYDIDFIVCALLVRAGVGETRGTIRERLHGLAARGRLSDADCATLDAAAELLRTVEHVVRLVLGRARKSLPAVEHARRTVEQMTARILGREFPEGLEREMERGFATVRAVYERVVK